MRKYTLQELRESLDSVADIQNDRHLSPDEKNAILAKAVSETWDTIVNSGLAEQYVKSVQFTSVPDQIEYVIDGEEGIITNGDFYKISTLYVEETQGYKRPIERINPAEITGLKAPSQPCNLVLYYIPCAPTWQDENGSYDDSMTFDGINGWEEHVVLTAAIHVKMKKDQDFSQLYRRKKDLEQRITSMSNTDWSGPSRVVKRWKKRQDPWAPFTTAVTGWCIRGGKLELYVGGPLYGYPRL